MATTETQFLAAPDPQAPDPEAPDPEALDPEAGEADLDAEVGPLRRCLITRERLAKERMIRFVLGPERVVVPDLTARLPGRGIWLSARGDVLETARAQGSLTRAFAKLAAKGDLPGSAKNAATDTATGIAKGFTTIGRGPVTLPPDFPDRIEAMLVRRVVELLGLARRAGQAVCGFQKAREWLTANRAGLVVQASDGSVDERARFLSGVTTTYLGVAGNLEVAGDLEVAGGLEVRGEMEVPRDVEATGSGDTGPDDRMRRHALPVGTPLSAASLGAVFGRDHVVHVVVASGRLAEALTNEIARLSGVTRRSEPGRKNAKAGPKAAGGDAGKIEAGQSGQDHDLNKRAGA